MQHRLLSLFIFLFTLGSTELVCNDDGMKRNPGLTHKPHDHMPDKIEAHIAPCKKCIQKTYHTFASELLILKELTALPVNDPAYLETYEKLMNRVLLRYKKEQRSFFLDQYVNYINTLIWGRNAIWAPLTRFVDLIEYTLENLVRNTKNLERILKGSISDFSQKRRLEQCIADLNDITEKLTLLKGLVQNHQYDFEQSEIQKMSYTPIIIYSSAFLLGAIGAIAMICTGTLPQRRTPVFR